MNQGYPLIHGDICTDFVHAGLANTEEYSGFLHSWYDGGFITAGAGAHIKPSIALVEALGPVHCLFIKPEK